MINIKVYSSESNKFEYVAKLVNFLYLPEHNSERLSPGVYGVVVDEYGDHWLAEQDLIVIDMKGQQ